MINCDFSVLIMSMSQLESKKFAKTMRLVCQFMQILIIFFLFSPEICMASSFKFQRLFPESGILNSFERHRSYVINQSQTVFGMREREREILIWLV